MSAQVFSPPPFRARAAWWGGDLQTVRSYMMRDYPDLSPWPSELLAFQMANGDRLTAEYHVPAEKTDQSTVMLIHGFTGCAESAYMFASAKHLLEQGHPVIRLNFRGAGPSRAQCCELYHAGRSEDLGQVIEQLPLSVMEYGLAVVGFSLGGNMLLKYLGEAGDPAPLSAAVSVSAPIDLVMANRRIGAWRNRFYHRWLVANTAREWFAGPSTLDEKQRDAVRQSRTLFELDEAVVGPLNGFTGAIDYYQRSSAKKYLANIRVPTLILHSADDPWIPVEMYRHVDWRTNDNLVPAISEGGGHVGFHAREGRWHDLRIADFLQMIG